MPRAFTHGGISDWYEAPSRPRQTIQADPATTSTTASTTAVPETASTAAAPATTAALTAYSIRGLRPLRKRGPSVAAAIAPSPTQPSSNPYPLDPSPSLPRATSGKSAQIAPAGKMNSVARAIRASSDGELATKRPPARVASIACSRGTAGMRAGTAVTTTAARTATNENALTPKTTAALVAARSAPPIAGPTARARF